MHSQAFGEFGEKGRADLVELLEESVRETPEEPEEEQPEGNCPDAYLMRKPFKEIWGLPWDECVCMCQNDFRTVANIGEP